MAPRIEGTWIVTGASRGLGEALALRVAAPGVTLVLIARGVEALDDVAARVRAQGATAHVVPCDLGDAAALAALPDRIRQVVDRVDVLVHNAGIEPFGAFETFSAEATRATIAVNLTAPVELTRALLDDLVAAKGQVVFLGSTSGLFSSPFAATYGATKAGIAVLARSLDVELGDRDVVVTVVQPGFVDDVGMFHDARGQRPLTPPVWLGSTTSARVVEAVVDAVAHRRRDVVVNSAPLRLGTALGLVVPRLGFAFMRRLVRPFMARLASP